MTFDGESYQARFDAQAAAGADMHGEATFIRDYAPRSVLDAGCGTGRVAIELARHDIAVTGADLNASMLAVARVRGPAITWIESDLGSLDLGTTFEMVAMCGNVPLFTPPGTQAALVAGCARHVAPGGTLVAGFQLGREYALTDYDAHCRAVGLELEARYASWDRDPFGPDAAYAVSVHRR